MDGFSDGKLPCTPALLTDTRSVVFVTRSWTKTSSVLLVSSGTRLAAREEKATKRPSAENFGVEELELPGVEAQDSRR